MITLMQRFKLAPRLSVAFGTLIVLSTILSATALHALTENRINIDQVVNRNMHDQWLATQMRDANAQIYIDLRNLLMVTSQVDNDRAIDGIRNNRKRYQDAFNELLNRNRGTDIGALLEKIPQIRAKALVLNDVVIGLGSQNRNEEAQAILFGKASTKIAVAWSEAIRVVETREEEAARQAYAATLVTSTRARTLLITMTAITLILGSILAWVINTSVTRPIRQAMASIEGVSRGNLDLGTRYEGRDEVGAMLTSTRNMMLMLQRFSDETKVMTHKHAAEDIGHRMPEDFPGVYGELAQGINTMMFEHLDAIADSVDILSEYARGDLSRNVRRLPGSRAVLHESMDPAKASLLAINSEIKRMAAAAAVGDFSARGDEAAFEHDFRAMIGDLNHLMATADHSLGAISHLLQSIADGGLIARMQGDFHGVFAQMRDDANATAEQLADIVGRIKHASAAINTAAGEIASGNDDLSRRTELQVANLEETAASMEELSSTVKQNAEHALQANHLAQGAAGIARDGGDVVSQVVTTMSEIERSSKKIGEIISVIDGIAFQTNILALNAAVEAARAGEQGRGFAVVASEVRTLAQRSASAAKEIKGLIDDSSGRVADGSTLVRKAGATTGEIVASVQRVTDIMAEISAASQEQSSGIEQVNQTITQMDETAQQNAALVEEATAAARSMEEQAGQLAEAVAIFRLHDDGLDPSVTRLLSKTGNERVPLHS